MKKNLSALALVIGLSVPFAAKMQSQVKIGDEVTPTKGAILDLNKTKSTSYEGGLLLPVVDILDMEYIPAAFTDAPDMTGYDAVIGVDTISALRGMIVYNSNVDTGRGVYHWDGEKWKPAGKTQEPREECLGCEDPNAKITAFVNVMYDFQHQTLEAYGITGATKHLWQVSTDNFASDIKHLSGNGANTANYTIPADLIHDYDATVDSLSFRCLMTSAAGVRITTPAFHMLFIRTNTEGYGIDNGVRYLTIQKGEGGNNTPATAGTIKIALLSLGQSDGDNAADLGDFYQWGRVADGHQKTVWSKPTTGTSRANQIAPFSGGGNATSEIIAKTAVTQTYTNYTTDTYAGQINDANAVGKFITNVGDWGEETAASGARWGIVGTGILPVNRTSDKPLTAWSYPRNNPCPAGWGVPSRWNWWDMYRGTGEDVNITQGNYEYTVNTWRWRATDANGAYGGAIITNKDGEKVFLPAAGYRDNTNGGHDAGGGNGWYWSSTTIYNSPQGIYELYFEDDRVNAGNSTHNRAFGSLVRCVQE